MTAPRPDYPSSLYDARSVRAVIILGIMDLVTIGLVIMWIIFACGGGSWPGLGDPDTKITLFHGFHLILDFSAILLFALSVLYVPIWFTVFGIIALCLDVFVIVCRYMILTTPSPSLFCTLFLFFFDIIFVIIAIMFIGFSISGIVRFGVFGNRGEYVPVPATQPTQQLIPAEAQLGTSTMTKRMPFDAKVSF